MKRAIRLIFWLLLCVFCAGCKSAVQAVPAETEIPAAYGDESKVWLPESTDRKGTAEIAGSEVPETEAEEQNTTLVVYFSATGTTRGVAEKIAAITGADLKEIIPAQPYTNEDLDYGDRSTRASAEQNNPDARPEIANAISLDGYTTLYLGYPIWWGQAPRILSRFVESSDFSGVVVIPFCTSGSSDIGQSDDSLAAQAGSGTWVQGRRFDGNVTEEMLKGWISEMEAANMGRSLHIAVDGTDLAVDWEDNDSVRALMEQVSSAPLTVRMSMYGGFEKVGALGIELPRNDRQTTTLPGDIVLYSGNQIVVFFGSNSWAYTRLGRITDRSASELTELLGNGDVTIMLAWK